MRNDVDLCDMAKIYVKWLKDLDKRLTNVEIDLDIWEMAKIIVKWLRYMGHGLSI